VDEKITPQSLHRKLHEAKVANLASDAFLPGKNSIDMTSEACAHAILVEVTSRKANQFEDSFIQAAAKVGLIPLCESTGPRILCKLSQLPSKPVTVASWVPRHDSLPNVPSKWLWKFTTGGHGLKILSRVERSLFITGQQLWIFGIAI
jgi:hypothetical protein